MQVLYVFGVACSVLLGAHTDWADRRIAVGRSSYGSEAESTNVCLSNNCSVYSSHGMVKRTEDLVGAQRPAV